MDNHAEAVAVLLLFPRVTGHQGDGMHIGEGLVVVGENLKRVLVAKPCTTVCTTIIGTDAFQLRVVRVVGTVSALVVVERIVGIQYQTLDDLQRSLGDDLLTFPDVLCGILIDE